MTVISKKNEKVENVVSTLKPEFTNEEFISKFIELYPTDWNKLVKENAKYMQKIKPGKINPMPNPEQYLINALNVWKKTVE